MTVQTFQNLLARRPFEPFAVVLSCGERYNVRHPEMAFLTRTTLFIGTQPNQRGIPADAAMCSLLHITAVEPARNGRRSQPSR